MQKHLVTAKPNERAIQSAQPTGNQWPKLAWQVLVRQRENLPHSCRAGHRELGFIFGPGQPRGPTHEFALMRASRRSSE